MKAHRGSRANTIVVAGSLAQRPGIGGHAWVFLQYLLGFRRLGFDVLFVDRLTGEMQSGDAGRAWLARVMEGFGLGGAFTLLDEDGVAIAGVSRRQAAARIRESAFLLNVMGFLDDEELLAAAPVRAFLDIDPGFGQMWWRLGLADVFAGHDVHLTVGANVGRRGCTIPTCGLRWIPVRQPVVLEEWPFAAGGSGFTSVGAWRGPYEPVRYGGARYGLRVHEFRRLARLPRLVGPSLAPALDIDAADAADRALLVANGWGLRDPRAAAGDPWAYRAFVRSSLGELCVAKEMYVSTRSGWFSDRSICYLASGKPVVAQDTGLAGVYPTGAGLLTFTTLDEAAVAIQEVSRDPRRHAREARGLAEEYFDSDRVLVQLVDRVAAAA